VNNESTSRTVAEIANQFGIPESAIVQAIQSNELLANRSNSGAATIEDDEVLHDWIANNPLFRPTKGCNSYLSFPSWHVVW
jgi:hypothetical protein